MNCVGRVFQTKKSPFLFSRLFWCHFGCYCLDVTRSKVSPTLNKLYKSGQNKCLFMFFFSVRWISDHIWWHTELVKLIWSCCGNLVILALQLSRQNERQHSKAEQDTTVKQSPDSILWLYTQSLSPWSVVLIDLSTPWNGDSMLNCKFCIQECVWP